MLVLRQRDDAHAQSHTTPADTLLVVEVSDSTRAFDLGRKAEPDARFGVTEYWVVDLVAHHVSVHRMPEGNVYADVEAVGESSLTPNAVPDVALDVAALLP